MAVNKVEDKVAKVVKAAKADSLSLFIPKGAIPSE